MRPSRIRVFDGLRMATEHIDHLQDALHSSIADIRQVLGLGKVFYGFDVQPQGESAIMVGPGLAFDRRRNRVLIDEPTLVDVSFPPGQETRYVCVRHEEVEDGEVEGRSTLVWDSAEVVLHDALPTPDDDLVAVAKLVRPPDAVGPSFQIVKLTPEGTPPSTEPPAPPPEPEPELPPGEGPTAEASEDVSAGVQPPPAEPAPAEAPVAAGDAAEPPGADSSSDEPAARPEPEASTSEESTPPSPAPAEAEATAAPTTSSSPEAVLRIRQGVLDLPRAAPPDPGPLAAMAAALRARLGNGGDGDVRVALAGTEVPVDFAPSALSCATSVSTTLVAASGASRHCLSTAHGEATLADGSYSQFGLSSVESPVAPPASAVWAGAQLIDGGLAHLPLGALAVDEEPGPGREALEHLQLVVEAAPAAPSGFGVSCVLVWKGDVDEERAAALEDDRLSLSWGARVGWKATGG